MIQQTVQIYLRRSGGSYFYPSLNRYITEGFYDSRRDGKSNQTI